MCFIFRLLFFFSHRYCVLCISFSECDTKHNIQTDSLILDLRRCFFCTVIFYLMQLFEQYSDCVFETTTTTKKDFLLSFWTWNGFYRNKTLTFHSLLAVTAYHCESYWRLKQFKYLINNFTLNCEYMTNSTCCRNEFHISMTKKKNTNCLHDKKESVLRVFWILKN